jgi:hypothetical protein
MLQWRREFSEAGDGADSPGLFSMLYVSMLYAENCGRQVWAKGDSHGGGQYCGASGEFCTKYFCSSLRHVRRRKRV